VIISPLQVNSASPKQIVLDPDPAESFGSLILMVCKRSSATLIVLTLTIDCGSENAVVE
jgi:hypothetical protein